MSDARAWSVLLMRDKPFSQFGHHFVLNFCLAGEPVDKVLSRIILDNAASRVCRSLLQVDWRICMRVTIEILLWTQRN